MCGEDLPPSAYSDRFGALAVLSPTRDVPSSTAPDGGLALSGCIAFFNENNHDCEVATHLRFSPSGTLDPVKHQNLFLNIHELGDLSVLPTGFDVSRSISLSAPSQTGPSLGTVLHRLHQPLHLHVGDDRHGNRGIIGRRVTVCCATPGCPSPAVVAEGIVGYNSIPKNPLGLL